MVGVGIVVLVNVSMAALVGGCSWRRLTADGVKHVLGLVKINVLFGNLVVYCESYIFQIGWQMYINIPLLAKLEIPKWK